MILHTARTLLTNARRAAAVATAAAGAFLLFLVAAHVAKSDLDPSWQPISAYALGSFGWLMTAAFASWGVSGLALCVALRPHAAGRAGVWGRGALLAGACGSLLAAVFPMDPIGPDAEITISGAVHNMAAVLGDGYAIAAALVTLSLVRQQPGNDARRGLVWSAALVWVAFVGFTAAMVILLPQHGGTLGPDTPVGWPGRAMVVAYAVWIGVAARYAVRESPAGRTPLAPSAGV